MSAPASRTVAWIGTLWDGPGTVIRREEIAVFVGLLHHVNHDGVASIAVRTLATRLYLRDETVRRALGRLEERGLLTGHLAPLRIGDQTVGHQYEYTLHLGAPRRTCSMDARDDAPMSRVGPNSLAQASPGSTGREPIPLEFASSPGTGQTVTEAHAQLNLWDAAHATIERDE
jgi:DNA-binding transcriptional MocR family regulator